MFGTYNSDEEESFYNYTIENGLAEILQKLGTYIKTIEKILTTMKHSINLIIIMMNTNRIF